MKCHHNESNQKTKNFIEREFPPPHFISDTLAEFASTALLLQEGASLCFDPWALRVIRGLPGRGPCQWLLLLGGAMLPTWVCLQRHHGHLLKAAGRKWISR